MELTNMFLNGSQVKNNRSSEKYEFNHANMARRALKNVALGMDLILAFSCYLGAISML